MDLLRDRKASLAQSRVLADHVLDGPPKLAPKSRAGQNSPNRLALGLRKPTGNVPGQVKSFDQQFFHHVSSFLFCPSSFNAAAMQSFSSL
jgi:hypothetical protein